MRHEREILQSHTNQLRDLALQRVSAADEMLHGLANLFNASTFVDRDEFRVFNRDLLARHDFILSALYLPLVRGGGADAV